MKNTKIIIFAAVLALGGGIFARGYFAPVALANPIPLAEFTMPDVSGKPHNIKEWESKIRIINFWATWCPPCLKEIPMFKTLQQQFTNNGLQFIGVAVDDQASVKEYMAKTDINYPILIGDLAGIALSQQLGNTAGVVPYTLIVNQQGQVIYQHNGEISREQIIEIITPLLN